MHDQDHVSGRLSAFGDPRRCRRRWPGPWPPPAGPVRLAEAREWPPGSSLHPCYYRRAGARLIVAIGRQSFGVVKSAAQDLLVIINDLLDFAKIEAGKVDLLFSAFSLRGLVRDALRTIAIRAHKKGVEVLGDVAAELADDVVGDPVRLRQILINLLGNAVKFTERGEIVVKVEPDADARVRFAVSDTGIGIAREEQEVIFAAFEQATSQSRRGGGTGLGLTIAARLVDLMGGRI